jgi:hypothetical protein
MNEAMNPILHSGADSLKSDDSGRLPGNQRLEFN